MSSQVDTQVEVMAPTVRSVELIDCDVHAQATEAMLAKYLSAPARRMLERYGRRTPRITEWYPRARHAGMRVDAWPGKPGHIWGSDPELTREQLLDEFDVDYAVLEVLSGQDCYDHPDFAAEWNPPSTSGRSSSGLDSTRVCAGRSRWRTSTHRLPSRRSNGAGRRRSVRGGAAAGERRRAARQSPKYWPIYEAATAHGRPVAFHTGGYVDHRGAGLSVVLSRVPRRQRDRHAGPARQHGAGGMFDEIPGLRVVLTECGVAWAAALRWSLDAAWELMQDDHPRLTRKPSEYIDEHVWFTTQPIEEPDDPQHLCRRSTRRTRRTGCCSPPTIRTGTSTRRSRRCRARSEPSCGGRSCARTRSLCTGCRRAGRLMDDGRLRRPLRARVV